MKRRNVSFEKKEQSCDRNNERDLFHINSYYFVLHGKFKKSTIDSWLWECSPYGWLWIDWKRQEDERYEHERVWINQCCSAQIRWLHSLSY